MNELAHWMGLVALIVGVPLNIGVAIWAQRLAHKSNRPVLQERLFTARIVLLTVTVFSLTFMNNDSIPPPLDPAWVKLATRAAIDLLAIGTTLRWLRLFMIARKEATDRPSTGSQPNS